VKRALDLLVALAGLAAVSPLLGLAMLAIWAQDGHSPLHRGVRVGRGGRDFRMLKLRSMRAGAERQGGTSTARDDARITPLGHWLRRSKLDELPQLWNVVRGEMSLVGPRPNTRRGGVERYTAQEMRLLGVRPGITDLASIVFADEADILDGAADPDARYDAVIRPWKSRLGLLYVERRSFGADLAILGLTALAIPARPLALRGVDAVLARWGADDALRSVCRRSAPLRQADPPGAAA
jgi:lipopolysaccharide/colanic/teichoic acid biosynthesis glycosyltransferase